MSEDTVSVARQWLSELERTWVPDADTGSESKQAGAIPPDGSPPLDAETRERIVTFLQGRLAEPSPVPGGGDLKKLEAENKRLRQQLELSRTSYDYLVRLAHHFSGDVVSFDSPEQIRAFCERVRRSIGILVGEVQELLRGRRQVQKDWSLYSSSSAGSESKESAGGTAFIRVADLHGDLGRALFDWRNTNVEEGPPAGIKIAIDELKHHQLALMAGLQRCIKDGCLAVLREVSPEGTESEYLTGSVGGYTGDGFYWRKLLPWRTSIMWRRLKTRHEELIDEDVEWFQSRFLPSFREGYKEYMWAKMHAQSGQKPPETKGES